MTNDNFLQVKQEYDKISKYCDPKADEIAVDTGGTVSYTHLTLPTN